MAGIPYTYFYPAEYLNDTQHLTREQHGSYLLLLMSYWQSGKALNNKNGRLAVIAKMTKEQWLEEESIYAEFFDIEDDIWHHGRCEFDLERVRNKSKQASYAGRASAKKKSEAKSEREINARSTPVEVPLNETSTMNECMNEGMNKRLVQTSFERFWKVYPRRDGKKKAQEAFEKALKAADIEVILEGVNKYIAFLKTTTQATAMAVTWLNGERWNDEIVSVPNGVITSPTPTPPRMTDQERAKTGRPMPKGLREAVGI